MRQPIDTIQWRFSLTQRKATTLEILKTRLLPTSQILWVFKGMNELKAAYETH
jgi:hypothetical protein